MQYDLFFGDLIDHLLNAGRRPNISICMQKMPNLMGRLPLNFGAHVWALQVSEHSTHFTQPSIRYGAIRKWVGFWRLAFFPILFVSLFMLQHTPHTRICQAIKTWQAFYTLYILIKVLNRCWLKGGSSCDCRQPEPSVDSLTLEQKMGELVKQEAEVAASSRLS